MTLKWKLACAIILATLFSLALFAGMATTLSGCDSIDCCAAHRPCGEYTPEYCPLPVSNGDGGGSDSSEPDAGSGPNCDGGNLPPDGGDLPLDGGPDALPPDAGSPDASDSGAPGSEYECEHGIGCCVSRCVKWHRNWNGHDCEIFCKEENRD